MKLFTIAYILINLIPTPAIATPRTCNVIRVTDGDTIRANCQGTIERIRFCAIDAPEKKQQLGNKSTAFLKQLLSVGKVEMVPIETDRYGRTVAEVFVGDRNINAEMVKAGMAYHYAKYSRNCPSRQEIINAEAIAQRNKVGVWDGGNYQKPWDFRRNR